MKINYSDIQEILNSPCVHPWVKAEYASAQDGDIVAAIADVELLAAMLKAKFAGEIDTTARAQARILADEILDQELDGANVECVAVDNVRLFAKKGGC